MNWNPSDIITTDKYLAAFRQNYYKMDSIQYDQPMDWRGSIHQPPSKTSRIIISGHSDFPITEQLAHKYPFAVWFGVNKQTSHVRGLPLGITNNTNESEYHPIYGNVDMMVDVVSKPRDIKNLVYMNFSIETYPTERGKVWNMFSNKDWVTVGNPENSMEGRRTFLENARNHDFVLCPRGNGVDTHRLWETLYMGSIPIVISDIAHTDWNDLPILFVNSWEDVTEEFLQKQLYRIQNTSWNLKKLHVGYWIKHIQETVK